VPHPENQCCRLKDEEYILFFWITTSLALLIMTLLETAHQADITALDEEGENSFALT
jgi:hypothetical protein